MSTKSIIDDVAGAVGVVDVASVVVELMVDSEDGVDVIVGVNVEDIVEDSIEDIDVDVDVDVDVMESTKFSSSAEDSLLISVGIVAKISKNNSF